MNDDMVARLRQDLEARKAAIEGDVTYMANEMRAIGVEQDDESGSVGNHIAEDGSSIAEAERIVAVTEDLQIILQQVNEALERMDKGTYGDCLRCGRRIQAARLQAFPYVAHCIECQAVIERDLQLRAGD